MLAVNGLPLYGHFLTTQGQSYFASHTDAGSYLSMLPRDTLTLRGCEDQTTDLFDQQTNAPPPEPQTASLSM